MMTAKTTSEILGEQYISNNFTKVGKNPEDFFKLLNALDEVTTFDKVFIKILFCVHRTVMKMTASFIKRIPIRSLQVKGFRLAALKGSRRFSKNSSKRRIAFFGKAEILLQEYAETRV